MADRKFTVAPGDEIIIRVPGKSKTAAERKPARRKGLIRARRPDDSLPRRLSKAIIRFYDLGSVKNSSGDFIDLDFTRNHGIQESGAAFPFTLADLEDYEQQFFDAPLSTWTNYYRKFDYAEAYRRGLLYMFDDYPATLLAAELRAGNADWTPNGLKVKGEKLTVLGNAFVGFDLANLYNAATHITGEFDPDAAAIENFKFKGAADVFLVPNVCLRSGVTATTGESVFAGFGIHSRELFLPPLFAIDAPEPEPIIEDSIFAFYSGNRTFATLDPNYGVSFPIDQRDIRTNITRTFAEAITEKFLSYPGATSDGDVPPAGTGSGWYTVTGFEQTHLRSFTRKVLAAVIVQNNETYYVWRALDSINYYGALRFEFLYV